MFFALAVLEYFLDQLSKFLILKYLPLEESIPIIKPIIYFHHIQNQGGAFGLFPEYYKFYTLISILVISGMLIYSKKILSLDKGMQIALGLILGAACGNLTDRLRFGGVIDFIDLKFWPIFNLADSALTISIFYISFKMIYLEIKK
ncbi:MAG: signal peptidase II, partial [Armatimonadetes bacterium]|nr:signal peptidase II [Armatimonadota bacterium]